MKPARVALLVLCAVLAAHQPSVRSEPFATAFTFQAQLDQGGSPLNGTADLQFELFGVEKGGMPVGATVTASDLSVTGGLVNVRLDFGVDVFDGNDRWLEVSIRSPHDPSDTMPFTTLSPRQPVSPIPYALQTRGIFVDEDGLVTIGEPAEPSFVDGPANPMARMHVRGTPADRLGMLAEVTAMTGDATGVKGTTEDPGGRGVEGIGPGQGLRGEATAMSGTTHGVAGINCSDVGAGVMGHALDASGSADGVHGKTESPGGRGVFGEGKSEGVRGETLGNELVSRGVCGVSASETGEGVVGHASAGMGTTTGVRGMSDSADGTGVIGEGMKEGVRGEADGATGIGVCGLSTASQGQGVLGYASAQTGPTTGVRGTSDSVDGTGVVGQAVGNGTGVVGQSAMEGVRGEASKANGTARGICGISSSIDGEGVFGHALASYGPTYGVHGRSDSPFGVGVFGESTADIAALNSFANTGTGDAAGVGVHGVTSSINGAGVLGCAAAPGTPCNFPLPFSLSGAGVFGFSSAMSGSAPGVAGRSESFAPGVIGTGLTIGVKGEATSMNLGAVGVHGVTASMDGAGVLGCAAAPGTPCNFPLPFPLSGAGVFGFSSAMSGSAPGVAGRSESFAPGVIGTGLTIGVKGEATSMNLGAVGVHGVTSSINGAGVLGCAAAPGTPCNFPLPFPLSGAGVFGFSSAMSGSAPGVAGRADSFAPGVIGTGLTIGVKGEATSTNPDAVGVHGVTASPMGAGVLGCAADASAPCGGPTGVGIGSIGVEGVGRLVGVWGLVGEDASPSYGVHGVALSSTKESAGVLAEGGGFEPPAPRAAALEIRNGAINVGGVNRPAGRVQFSGPWFQTIDDCSGAALGWTQDVTVLNNLIVEDSIIWAAVELEAGPEAGRALSVVIFDKQPGMIKLRLSAVGVGGPCAPPSPGNRYVSYLIINSLP